MMRCMSLANDSPKTGGAELIEAWKDHGSGKIWIDVTASPSDEIREFLLSFNCDPLAINDAFRSRHPPKLEEFEEQEFFLFRGIAELGDDLQLQPQQLAIFLGDRYLITFHRGHSVSIDHFWERTAKSPDLLEDLGRLTQLILHYASGRYLDSILGFEDKLAELEDELLSGNSEEAMRQMVSYRARLRVLRRIFNYHLRLSEAVMNSQSNRLVADDDATHYKRDLFDRCERVYSLCGMYYEICGDLLDGYISLSSHRLNNTMKILTIITAIFVPLSFMAGIYGMNFENMPELKSQNGYFILLGFMALAVTTMLALFRRLKWL